jgi:hypothetical protein
MSFLSDVLRLLQSADGLQRLSAEAMKCHAACYRDNLQRCTEPMLQYEWAWLRERLAALRSCQTDASLLSRLGGIENVNLLVSECVLFQLLLQEEFSRRRLTPRAVEAPLVPSEEAWEITSLKVKQDWGIVPA